MKTITLIIILVVSWLYFYHIGSAPSVGNGELVQAIPFETDTETASFELNGFTVTPQKQYEVEGRVVAASKYYLDGLATLAPMDIVLGWGPMSDEHIFEGLDVSIGKRHYEWSENTGRLSREEVSANSNIFHVIPKASTVAKLIEEVRIGDILALQGYVVTVKNSSGEWESKKSLLDKESGAGKLFYIEHIEIISPYSRAYE